MPTPPTLSRRSFLGGRKRNSDAIRPPWSPSEDVFTDQCRRCGDCISACETGVLIKGSGGFPEADFSRAGCTFCEQCNTACGDRILTKQHERWKILPQISQQCLARNQIHCRTCQELCEVEAIRFELVPGGVALPEIDLSLCSGCGECVADCPVEAIKMKKAVDK